MIKITFEVSEDYIKTTVTAAKKNMNALFEQKPGDILRSLFGVCACRNLEKKIQEGHTEFVVTPSALTDTGLRLYNQVLDGVCACATEIKEDNDNKKVED